MEIPRLGVKSELQMLAYTTATVMQDLSQIWAKSVAQVMATPDPRPTEQDQELNPHPQIRFQCATMGTPTYILLIHNSLKI